MASTIEGVIAADELVQASKGRAETEQPWPSRPLAWWALILITLATAMNFFDAAVFGMMVESIKRDFGLSEIELGLLIGPAGVFFYLFVGIPLARLADIYSRKVVLGAGLVLTSGMTAVSGLAQGFGQFFVARAFTGVSGSAHAPASYSMIADLFPPLKLPRAFGFLQLGFISGAVLGPLLGAMALKYVSSWPPSHVGPLVIYNWQWVLIAIGVPGLVIAALIFMLPEPPRRGKVSGAKALPLRAVFAEINARRAVYVPLFIGLAFTSIEAQGIIAWRVPFLMRTYGWTWDQIGAWSSSTVLVSFLVGAFVGTFLTEWLSKRYKDGPVRTTAIVFTILVPLSVATPLMPTGELSMILAGIGGVFGMAGAVPQNTAIQTITPNEMRGQVTAVYLFMFTAFGAMGSFVVALITTALGGPEQLRWSMAIVAAVLLPAGAYAISRAMKPYAAEIERLESLKTA
jgi:MFS family permease